MITYVGLDLGVDTTNPAAPKRDRKIHLQRREAAAERERDLESVSLQLSAVPDIRLDFD
jgi:hypothetical protein